MRSGFLRYIFIFSLILLCARCSSAGDDVTIDSEVEGEESRIFLSISQLSIDLVDHNAASQSVLISSSEEWYIEVDDAVEWISISPTECNYGVTIVTISISANTETSTRDGSITIYTDILAPQTIEISQPASPTTEEEESQEDDDVEEDSEDEDIEEDEEDEDVEEDSEDEDIEEDSEDEDAEEDSEDEDVEEDSEDENVEEDSENEDVEEDSEDEDVEEDSENEDVEEDSENEDVEDDSEDEDAEEDSEDKDEEDEKEDIVYNIEIDTNTKIVTNETGSFSINITTNGAWTTSGVSTWIKLSAESGTGDSVITITYDANDTYLDRITTISFICDNIVAKLSIAQSGKEIQTLSLSSWLGSVDTEGGDFTIDVESNVSWSVNESIDWVTVSPESGVGNATVTVTYYENLYTTSRSGTISFSADDSDLVAEYYISQQSAATMISIDNTTKSVGVDSGTFTINVDSNTGWSVESSQPWAQPIKDSGNGSDIVTINYDTNLTTLQRQATITFTTTSGENTELVLTQEATDEVFVVSPTTTIVFPDGGGSESVSITSNLSWSIISSESWVTVDQYVGSGDAKITITASTNTTHSKRTASITLLAGSGTYTRTILIEQDTSQLPQFNIDTL